jgi:enhancing lycopene biosynthesis protein 2
MKKVAVVLCGAGRFDGSEIHESVLTLLHLSRAGAKVQAFAPDAPQWAVCEHFDGQIQGDETRNQLVESARIARGEVLPLSAANAEDFDALILPGGSGAAHNLCNFATAGASGKVIPELYELIHSFHQAAKPIGAICIAPAIVALALKDFHPQLTLGATDDGPAVEATKAGAHMVKCAVDQIHVDSKNQIVSTPAYILGPDIAAVDQGIGKLVAQVLELCK